MELVMNSTNRFQSSNVCRQRIKLLSMHRIVLFLTIAAMVGLSSFASAENLTKTDALKYATIGIPTFCANSRPARQNRGVGCTGGGNAEPGGCNTGCGPQGNPLIQQQANSGGGPAGIGGTPSTLTSMNYLSPASLVDSTGSVIDNWTYNYIHYGTDYSSEKSGLPWADLVLTRFLRTRGRAYYSRFGPGHFSNNQPATGTVKQTLRITSTMPMAI